MNEDEKAPDVSVNLDVWGRIPGVECQRLTPGADRGSVGGMEHRPQPNRYVMRMARREIRGRKPEPVRLEMLAEAVLLGGDHHT